MRNPLTLLVTIVMAMVVTLGAAVFTYSTVRRVIIESPIELPPPPQLNAVPTRTPVPSASTQVTANLPNGTAEANNPNITTDVSSVPVGGIADWPNPTRFTVLLLGIDQRPGEKGPFHTDTMMVLSIDPIRKSAVMLSIPRDIYMTIPDVNQKGTINTANFLGDLPDVAYPGGGPALAKKAAEKLLGIRIDRYIRVNFQAFITVINLIGPITVCPKEHILDDKYPDFDTYGVITVEFQAGCQDLDAIRLLQYARVRHSGGDDFGRAARQQEVIRAVKDKVLSLGGITAMLSQAQGLWQSLQGNLDTDLTFDEILSLAKVAQDIPNTNIRTAVLNIKTTQGGQLMPSTLEDGKQVLSPISEEISDLVVQLFGSTATMTNNPRANSEGAVLSVLNGTGIEGLAKQTADQLIAKGFTVSNVGNSEALGSYGQSEIAVYTDKMETARYLAEVLSLDGTQIVRKTDGPPGIDIVLTIGKDLAPK